MLAFFIGAGNTAIPGCGHGHFAGGQKLRRLRARLPPHHIFLDRIQLFKGTIDAVLGGQHLVDIRRCHTIGHQCKFEIGCRIFPQTTLAGKFLGVEQILDGGGAIGQLGPVKGQCGGINNGAHTAFGGGARNPFRLIADLRPVDLFINAFVTALNQGGRIHIHNVDRGVASLNHRLDLGNLAAIFLLDNFDALGRRIGLEHGLVLRGLIGAAKTHDRKLRGLRHGHAGRHNNSTKGNTCE